MFADWKRICWEYNHSTKPKDLVFRHPESTNQSGHTHEEIETINVAFKRVLEKLGLSTNAD